MWGSIRRIQARLLDTSREGMSTGWVLSPQLWGLVAAMLNRGPYHADDIVLAIQEKFPKTLSVIMNEVLQLKR